MDKWQTPPSFALTKDRMILDIKALGHKVYTREQIQSVFFGRMFQDYLELWCEENGFTLLGEPSLNQYLVANGEYRILRAYSPD